MQVRELSIIYAEWNNPADNAKKPNIATNNFVLKRVDRDGQLIVIEKQFNSMMKWPCIMENDTIDMGKLPSGNYILHYKLTDISTQMSNPEVLSMFFNLKVTE